MPTRTHARRHAPKNVRVTPPSGRKLTVEEITTDLNISQRTFYRWKKTGEAPPTFRLPGGGLRVWESDYNMWLQGREMAGAR